MRLEGKKISPSNNWAVWLHEYLEDFADKQDILRYTLTANAPETKDNDFTWNEFQTRNNSELVAIFGNFINRVMVLTHKYYNGKVPKGGTLNKTDQKVMNSLKTFPEKFEKEIEQFHFRAYSQELMNLARLGNKYLADQEPWKLIKKDPKRVETIINIALQIAAYLTVLSEPLLPFTANKMKSMLNVNMSWDEVATCKNILLMEGKLLKKSELLFARVEDDTIKIQLEKLKVNNTLKKDFN